MPVGLVLALSIVFVVISFGILPFLNYFVLPFNKKNRLNEVDGKIELPKNLSKALSSITIEEDKIVLKRAEGVQRIGLVVFYARGILTLRKYYYLELAQDEVSIPKLKKGRVFKMVVSEVDGNPSYKGIAYGINMPLFIATIVIQFVSTFVFSLLLSISFVDSLHNISTFYYEFPYDSVRITSSESWKFFVWPILLSIIVPLASFFAQSIALKSKGARKEVK